jgi:hypothetical protein
MGSPGDGEYLAMLRIPDRVPVMRQRWRRLGFLHWTVEPDAIKRLLPPGLELDTWEGLAYVGIVPFTIRGTRPPFLPAVPGVLSFHEVNVRTYVHHDSGEPGVWFFSLDAASRLAVWGARLTYKLPYFFARMSLTEQPADVVTFRSRRADEKADFGCTYQPTEDVKPAAAGTLEFFLVERYLLYSWDGANLRSARVWHQPYPLQSGRVHHLSQDLLSAAGISIPAGQAPLVHVAREVDVRIYRPKLVRARRSVRANATTRT